MTPERKRIYNEARRKALQDLARENPQRYVELVEARLGRPLDDKIGRSLPRRLKQRERASLS